MESGKAVWITRDEFDMMSAHCEHNGIKYRLLKSLQRADEVAVVIDDKTLLGIVKYRDWNNLPEIEYVKGEDRRYDPVERGYAVDIGKIYENVPAWKIAVVAGGVILVAVLVLISILRAL